MSHLQKEIKIQNTILPEIKFASNDAELNYLRKKMLAHFYDKQIREKNQDQFSSKRQSSLNTPRTTSQNPSSENPQGSRITANRENNYYQRNQMQIDRERSMKMQLAKQYEQQMKRKADERNARIQLKRIQDAKIIQGLKLMKQLQNQKMRRFHEINRNNMHEHIQIMERNKTEKAQQKRRDRQLFNKRYGIQRSSSSGALDQNSKQTQFKKHFQNVNQAQQQIEKLYLSKWSPIIQKREEQKDKLVNIGIFKTQESSVKRNMRETESQQRLLNNLKATLAQQMLIQFRRKEQVRNEKKNGQYTTKNYQNVYHPICNPVDFKITHDNKYIMRELRQQKYQQGRQTGQTSETETTKLARNGSFTLLSK